MERMDIVRMARGMIDFMRSMGYCDEEIAVVADAIKQHLVVEKEYEGESSIIRTLQLNTRFN